MAAIAEPPPVIGFARVLAYAVVDQEVTFTGRQHLYVDGSLLGPVPCLALCQSMSDRDNSEILVLHCDKNWNVLGVSGHAPTLDETKADVEAAYRGISAKWTDRTTSRDDARRWLEGRYSESMCSFCGRLPFEFETFFPGHRSGICNDCIGRFSQILAEEGTGSEFG